MSFPTTPLAKDFWRVNSYGYPSVFGKSDQAQKAWETFCSFFNFSKYDDLKSFWQSTSAPWKLAPHTVESWKATFEEFGLLFVESGSNTISITPAGQQLKNAADSNNLPDFAWIGLNLLFRYPLRGPRRSRGATHSASDLLLYRFLYSALLDLDGYFWWSELERILCRVFSTADAPKSVSDILVLRQNPTLIATIPLPAAKRHGAFYNSLNQVAVHAGMNHLLLGIDKERPTPYGVTEPKRMHFIQSDWSGSVRRALNATHGTTCAPAVMNVSRLPTAPEFIDEREYFDYAGQIVSPPPAATAQLPAVDLHGEIVVVLIENTNYQKQDTRTLKGDSKTFCQLATGQRLILSHDDKRTYIIESKAALPSGEIALAVRRARPIVNFEPIRKLLGQR